MKDWLRGFLFGTFVLFIVGCSDNTEETTPITEQTEEITTLTGQFVDSPVEGLNYSCNSVETGVTNANGEYTCPVDSNVTFMLGGVTIGTARASETPITPHTMFPDNSIASINLARLLQSLDSDGNLSNGIFANPVLVKKLPSDLSFEVSDFETVIESALPKVELVSMSEAIAHLNESMVSLGQTPPEGTTSSSLLYSAAKLADGTDAEVALITQTCSGDGVVLYSGFDLNNNGELDEDERSGEPLVVCDGVNGVDGQDGVDGVNGVDGQDGVDGVNGVDGVDGANGIDGKDGVDGVNGVDGVDGRDGLSAYEIWLSNDHNGTEADFLEWLQGINNITTDQNNTDSNSCVDDNFDVIDDNKTYDYTIQRLCVIYNFGTDSGLSWFNTFGNQPSKFNAYIIEDDGLVVDDFYYHGIDVGTGRSSLSSSKISYDSQYSQNFRDLIQSNLSNNLLLKCTYQKDEHLQEFYSFAPLKNDAIWEEIYSETNNQYFIVSMLSDLYYKIYKKSYEGLGDQNAAIEKASKFMEYNFPYSIYSTVEKNLYSSNTYSSSPESIQGGYYKFLRSLADDISNDNVSVLNTLIADQYYSYNFDNNICDNGVLCANFIDKNTVNLIKNSSFLENLDDWNVSKDEHNLSTLTLERVLISASPYKYNLKLTMDSKNNGSYSPSMIDISQSFDVDDLNSSYYFTIKSKMSYGWAENFAGASFWSGLAGYYSCFYDGDNNQMGCILFAHATDKITIPIRVGEIFKVESNNNFYIVPISSGYNRFSKNITDLLDRSTLSIDKSKVKKITIGGFVTEMGNSEGYCNNCRAVLEIEEIKLLIHP